MRADAFRMPLARSLLIAALMTVPAGARLLAADCPAPPAAARDLDLARYYADEKGTTVDPAAEARLRAATEPLTAFLGFVASKADRAWQQRSSPVETAACGLAWIEAWARAGAYMGTMSSKQAEAQRRWDLAGIALAYLKLKRFATTEQRQIVEPWLVALADKARAAFDEPGVKRNNHWYWMGLAFGATGVASGSDRHWQQARSIMQDAARDIGPDGILPLEMARGTRALHYHAFALMPLVTLAELAAARGEDWYALNDGALHRLVRRTLDGLADPGGFERLAGVTQERPVRTSSGWLTSYQERFRARVLNDRVRVPAAHRWLGGDVTVLARALQRNIE